MRLFSANFDDRRIVPLRAVSSPAGANGKGKKCDTSTEHGIAPWICFNGPPQSIAHHHRQAFLSREDSQGKQMLLSNAVECAVNPCLQISGDPTDHRQAAVHLGAVTAHRHLTMIVTQVEQVREFGAIVTDNNGTRCEAILRELLDDDSPPQ